jgi:hypothetical protein
MSMLLLLPVGLAALAALLLPLLVHLARRSEQRTVPFAALRWLRAAPHPRRRHRLEELLLLLLRLLLLAALALLLAEPVLFGRPDRSPRVAVAPGVDLAAARTLVGAHEMRWHLLAPGFPGLDPGDPAASADAPIAATPSPSTTLPSLLRQLDAELPPDVALTVVVPAVLDDADAQRPVLTREVDWRVLPAQSGVPREVATPPPVPALQLEVRHAPERTGALRYLAAAGTAWAQAASAAQERAGASRVAASSVRIAPLGQPLDTGARHLAWLAPGPVPRTVHDWVANGGTALLDADAQWPGFPRDAPIVWRDAEGALARAIRVGSGRAIRLERPLLPAAMPTLLEPDFPRRLHDVLAGEPPPPARVDARAYAPSTGAAPYPELPRPISPWLAMLIAGLFLLERWCAAGARRSAVA